MSETPKFVSDDTEDFPSFEEIEAARARLHKPAPIWSREAQLDTVHDEPEVAVNGLHKALHKAGEFAVGVGDVTWSMIKAFFTGES